MRHVVLAFVLGLLATPAASQVVQVRSGDHAGFTRFVFYLPDGAEGAATAGSRRIRIDVGAGRRFDLASAFDRISRARVRDLVPRGDGSLEMVLACDCGLQARRLPGNLLVVDVTDAPAGARRPAGPRLSFAQQGAGPEDPFRPFRPGPVGELRFAGASGAASVPTDAVAPAPIVASATPGFDSQFPRAAPVAILPGTLPDLTQAAALERRDRVREAEDQLIRQLAKAATQGLLQVAEPVVPPVQAAAPPPVVRPSTSRDVPSGKTSLSAESVIDRDRSSVRHASPVTSDGDACFGDDILDLSGWGGDLPFGPELGNLRAGLYDDRDRPRPEAALALARFYIYHGFGVEAREVLDTVPDSTVVWHTLVAMSEIVDDGHAEAGGPFRAQADCDSAVALWGLLASREPSPGRTVNVASILRSFDTLPAGLRRHLGPIIAERLRLHGRIEAADSVLARLQRLSPDPDPPRDLATAHLQIGQGEAAAAEPTLERLTEGNTPQSPAALVALIDARIDSGASIDANLETLAGAYAQELQGQPLGAEVQRVQAMARTARGDPLGGLEMIDALRGSPGFDWDRARSRLARLAAQAEDPLNLLAVARRLAAAEPDRIDARSANALATRLVALGFGDLALDLLGGPAAGEESRSRHLLRAEIALRDRRPRRAEAELLGLQGDDVLELRARAAAQRGDHDAARATYETLRNDGQAAREAWRAGDWSRVSRGDGPLADAAAVLALAKSGEDTPPDSGEGGAGSAIIARNRAVLNRSADVRGTLDALLQATAIPADAEEN